ncbi:MAG TPA: diguanylate cyclase, partial [Polyangiaceae bacterium]
MAWLVTLCVVAIVGSISFAYDRRYAVSLAAVHETLTVDQAIDSALSVLKDAETGQRGFALTGDEAFLKPYLDAERALTAKLRHLVELVQSDDAQNTSAREIERLAETKMAELSKTIDLRRQGRTDEALAIIRSGRGRELMEAIRTEAARMSAREAARLAERESEADEGRRRLTLVLAAVWGFFFCVVTAGLWASTRRVTEAKRANQRLMEREKALRAVADNASDLVRIIGNDAELIYVSPSCQRMLGFSQAEMLAMGPRALLPEDEREGALKLTLRVRAGEGGTEPFVHQLRTKNGEYRWFETTYWLVREGAESTGHLHLTSRDITERKLGDDALQRKTTELEESEERLRVLSEASFEGVAVSKGGTILDCNENFASWLGHTRGEIIGTAGLQYFLPEDHQHVLEKSALSDIAYEAHLLRKNGSHFPIEVRGRYLNLRGETVRIAVIRDITERRQRDADSKAQAELLRTMSLRDDLTGLFNRRGFLELAQQALRGAARARRPACLFYADLNGMKAINDSLGHEMGDRAIAATAKVLLTVFRDSDIVARLGGDEFAIFAPECAKTDIAGVRERIRQVLEDKNREGSDPFRVSISIGSSVFEPGAEPDLHPLMERADRDMYEEKRRARSAAASHPVVR